MTDKRHSDAPTTLARSRELFAIAKHLGFKNHQDADLAVWEHPNGNIVCATIEDFDTGRAAKRKAKQLIKASGTRLPLPDSFALAPYRLPRFLRINLAYVQAQQARHDLWERVRRADRAIVQGSSDPATRLIEIRREVDKRDIYKREARRLGLWISDYPGRGRNGLDRRSA